ncbi:hypothetical protein [Glutamicibacter halophytocola]|uniref:hypothetical protein n=1 Tax=Glutamicibacter halophytocola TaxID=1933880 RepID=UPI0015C56685|nr:hypothetical protein [Glutamicibacter halophytocola]NQD41439.1 hypothetical protein [Glutamicibacter halophytocola]
MNKNERIEDGQGRIHVYKPDHPLANTGREYPGYVLEHRMVAWDAGLLTDPALQVRHINKIPSDNRLENLKVSSAEPKKTRICQSCGQQFPMKLTICNDCRAASRVAKHEKTIADRALLDRVSSILPSTPSKEIGNELFNYVHIYTSRHLTTKLEKLFFAYSLDAVSAVLVEISNELKANKRQPAALVAEYAHLVEEARKLSHQQPEPRNKLTAAKSARKS